ncbi:hypothetical protein DBR06_SOUSAS1810168, partial [Sousa chinensis]
RQPFCPPRHLLGTGKHPSGVSAPVDLP